MGGRGSSFLLTILYVYLKKGFKKKGKKTDRFVCNSIGHCDNKILKICYEISKSWSMKDLADA